MMTPKPLTGRIALITGASRGIGAAIARRVSGAGARVVLLARDKAALASLAKELGGGAVGLACDLRDTDTLTRAIDQLRTQIGGSPDIIVNNAGGFSIAPAHETSVDAFRDTLTVNLTAPFAAIRALLPGLRSNGAGHIVTIGSIADRSVYPGNGAYAASKHGLRALHEVLRAELRGTGVRVSLVSPGPVDTPLWDSIDPDRQPGFTPRKDMLTPGAVADAVHYVLTAPADLNVDELRLSKS
ncbi:MAG: SDR family oxidoreductase [Gemmatimonadota bacterium]